MRCIGVSGLQETSRALSQHAKMVLTAGSGVVSTECASRHASRLRLRLASVAPGLLHSTQGLTVFKQSTADRTTTSHKCTRPHRCRAINTVPVPEAALYYSQRATDGGLLISEATTITPAAQGCGAQQADSNALP